MSKFEQLSTSCCADPAVGVAIVADDLGADAVRDGAIIHLARAGCIQQVSVIANPEYATLDDVCKPLSTIGRPITVALHFNVSDGIPLTMSLKAARELNLFNGKPHMYPTFTRAESDPALREHLSAAILGELHAQLAALRAASPLTVTHIDGHHHVLAHPFAASIVAPALPTLGIKSIRTAYEPSPTFAPPVLPAAPDAPPVPPSMLYAGPLFATSVAQWATDAKPLYDSIAHTSTADAFCGLWTMSDGVPVPCPSAQDEGDVPPIHLTPCSEDGHSRMCGLDVWAAVIGSAIERAKGARELGATVEVMTHPGGLIQENDAEDPPVATPPPPLVADGEPVPKRWQDSAFHRDPGRKNESVWLRTRLQRFVESAGASLRPVHGPSLPKDSL